MKRLAVSFLGVAAVCFVVGCASQTAPATTARWTRVATAKAGDGPARPRQPLTKEDAEFRLTAASKIVNANDRNDAYRLVALDAADAGLGDAVKKALDGIVNFTVKSDTAGQCALKLAHAGKRAEAMSIAESIPQIPARDATLKKLASGQD